MGSNAVQALFFCGGGGGGGGVGGATFELPIINCEYHSNLLFLCYLHYDNRTCVNGKLVEEKTLLKHGDRILWGNNHYFRINCPRPPGLLLLSLIF